MMSSFVHDQHAELDLCNTSSSLKQQFTGRHVAPTRHNIINLSQQVLALTHSYMADMYTTCFCHSTDFVNVLFFNCKYMFCFVK